MAQAQSWFLNVLPALPILLVHLAGVVVAIILLMRHKSTPAILALVGFAILLLLGLASFGRAPLISAIARQGGGLQQFAAVNTGVGCCCNLINMAAVACLIVAIWQAVAGPGAKAEEEQ
jgi:hypothetical protein